MTYMMEKAVSTLWPSCVTFSGCGVNTDWRLYGPG